MAARAEAVVAGEAADRTGDILDVGVTTIGPRVVGDGIGD
jgi:hypothetical protein